MPDESQSYNALLFVYDSELRTAQVVLMTGFVHLLDCSQMSLKTATCDISHRLTAMRAHVSCTHLEKLTRKRKKSLCSATEKIYPPSPLSEF